MTRLQSIISKLMVDESILKSTSLYPLLTFCNVLSDGLISLYELQDYGSKMEEIGKLLILREQALLFRLISLFFHDALKLVIRILA